MRRRDFLAASIGAAAFTRVDWSLAAQVTAGALPAELAARTLDGEATTIRRADLENLARSLRGHVLVPGQDGYDAARRLWNGSFDRRPAVIVRCESATDVMSAVDFARGGRYLTAVRGGGHSSAGKSSCDGGVMIDLQPMQSVRVDPVARLARVEAGALLGMLDHETARFGLVTTAGTVSHTGAAGLTLGGGVGRVGRRFGLACDNVVQADVVTADGRLLRASAKDNPDLYWGVRGGGGNFGVTTSFEYRLYPMDPTVVAGQVAWPADQLRDVLRMYRDHSQESPDELNTDLAVLQPPGGPMIVAIECVWSGPAAGAERAMAKIRGFGRPIADDVRPVPYVDVQRRSDEALAHGIRHYSKAAFATSTSDELVDAIVEAAGLLGGDAMIVFQQMGGAYGRVPVEATAFANRDARWWLMVMANWRDASEDARRLASVRRAWPTLERFVSGYYVNTMSSDGDVREMQVYGRNYERMRRLKTKYDPGNLFRLNANVRPA